MIKLVGICILFLSSGVLYEAYASKKDKEISEIKDIILFSKLLYVNVMELKMELQTAISSLKFKISPFTDTLIDDFLDMCRKKPESSVRNNLKVSFLKLALNKKIKTELTEYIMVLGNTDKETALSYRNTAIKNCEDYLSEYKKKSESKRKTAGAIAFGMSAVIVIVLL